jgi:hypothetical protein
MAGKAARVAVERCGRQPRYNKISYDPDWVAHAARVLVSATSPRRTFVPYSSVIQNIHAGLEILDSLNVSTLQPFNEAKPELEGVGS